MSEHTPTPWIITGVSTGWGTDNGRFRILGAATSQREEFFICENCHASVRGPDAREQAANAALIVKAVNSHEALVKALKDILDANYDFRNGMPDDWEGDPLQDACSEAAKLIDTILPTAEDVRGILAPVGGPKQP